MVTARIQYERVHKATVLNGDKISAELARKEYYRKKSQSTFRPLVFFSTDLIFLIGSFGQNAD